MEPMLSFALSAIGVKWTSILLMFAPLGHLRRITRSKRTRSAESEPRTASSRFDDFLSSFIGRFFRQLVKNFRNLCRTTLFQIDAISGRL